MRHSEYFNLNLPDGSDRYNVEDFNENTVVIDRKLNELSGTDGTLQNHIVDVNNPHNVTKEQIGLGNVGNFLAVSTNSEQALSEAQKANARANMGVGSVSTIDTGDDATTFLRNDGTWAVPPGAGTSDYTNLSNKPKINSTTLTGNKTAANLGLQDIMQMASFPTASTANVGKIYQYIGTTTSSLTHGYFYESKLINGAYAWTQIDIQPGGDADATLEEDVTSNLAVGAIARGTTLTAGTTFTEFAKKLLISEVMPTFSFSISKSGSVAYGNSYIEVLTLTCASLGSAKKIKTIAWYEGSTLKRKDTVDSSTTGTWTYAMTTATTNTTTFKAVIVYTKSDDTDQTLTMTASINFYYNKFYGGVSALNPTEATVEALTSALATSKSGTYSFTVSNGRICYAYPKSLGTLSSIKDGNGFSLFDSFTRTEVTYTQNATSVAYYRYVLTDPVTVSGYSVIFA